MTKETGYTGIDIHEGRIQPYTVWVDGHVEKFCVTEAEAETAFLARLDFLRMQDRRQLVTL